MKKLLLLPAVLFALAIPAQAQDLFTGDVRLACEAILCLSSETRPSECTPALNCSAYPGNASTDLSKSASRYVGIPERGGSWVEAKDYAQTLADYNARIAAEDAAAKHRSAGY